MYTTYLLYDSFPYKELQDLFPITGRELGSPFVTVHFDASLVIFGALTLLPLRHYTAYGVSTTLLRF
jgi:hypothetical protein